MLAYINRAGLAHALATRDWHAFARGYNGPAYAANGYHLRLARAFALYAARDLSLAPATGATPAAHRPSPPDTPGTDTQALQRQLSALGYPVAIDGIYGPRTRAAVTAFQRDHRLATDGVAGPRTWQALRAARPWAQLWRRLSGWLAAIARLAVPKARP